jgi:hypothetical protein
MQLWERGGGPGRRRRSAAAGPAAAVSTGPEPALDPEWPLAPRVPPPEVALVLPPASWTPFTPCPPLAGWTPCGGTYSVTAALPTPLGPLG